MLARDIRLTERQLYYGIDAIKRRRRDLEKRLERTSYDGKPGMKDSVLTELAELTELERVLDHNWREIGRKLAASVLGTLNDDPARTAR